MFCPRCGNQAASDRMRFCPACGFRLDGVIDLLAREGLPSNPQIVPQVQELSPRKRGIRRGAMLTFSSLAMFLPVLYFSMEIVRDPFPLLMLSSVFIAGIFCMIYYRLFGEEYAPPSRPVQVPVPATQPQAYLAPPQSVPVYRSADEPQRQQSVIENTTRTLGHE